VPCGKISNGKHYSIITDHLGTPIEAYNQEGELIWEREQDLYGNSRQGFAKENFRCPFKYQGQYYDSEVELCYNRFRYYHPETGRYISEDPIKLLGGFNVFAYVGDTNAWVDLLGLRALHYSEIEALDQRISELGMEDAEKGVYNFTNNIDKNYTGSAGTGNGTNTIRDRLMQHMRNDHLLVKDLDSLTIINMNDKSDKEVLMKEATTIKEHGGIGDPNVANQRRPKGTDNIAKKNS